MCPDSEKSITQKHEAFKKKMEMLTLSGDGYQQFRELEKAALSAGLNSVVGTVSYAGSTSTGSKQVQFNIDGGGGYASNWPEWAYSIAKDALLNRKKLWIISIGDPFGSNLQYALLYYLNV
jgi:hypothetical protein